MRPCFDRACAPAKAPSSTSTASTPASGRRCSGQSRLRDRARGGVHFFVYGNVHYTLKKAGYRSEFRTGHYDGKGRIGEWILMQNRSNGHRMGAALFTTGPYIEMAFSAQTPMTPRLEDGVPTWRVPLGVGAVVTVAR